MEPVQEHWDILRQREDAHWWFVSLKNYLRCHTKSLNIKFTDVILDLGCGTGGVLRDLARVGFLNLIGIDISERAVTLAKSECVNLFICADGTNLPLQSGSIKLAVTVDMIGSGVASPDLVISEIYRVLSPDGIAVIHVPAYKWLESRHDALVDTRKRFSRSELCGLLKNAGFKVKISTYHYCLIFPMIAIWKVCDRAAKSVTGSPGKLTMTIPPSVFNGTLKLLCWLDCMLIPWISLPFGSSVCVVVQK